MERRPGSFFIFATLIFLFLLLFRNFFAPPDRPAAEAERGQAGEVAVEGDVDGDADVQGDATADEQESSSGDSDQDADPPGQKEEDDIGQIGAADDTSVGTGDDSAGAGFSQSLEPEKFYTIGRLDPEGRHKNLVTLTSRGAAVHRVELNARKPDGNLVYRELEYEAGYIGHLELADHSGGAEIRLVAPGTPAERAGMQIGDVISTVNGEPVAGSADFWKIMGETGIGEQIDVRYSREGDSRQVTLTVDAAPLQIISPIPPDEKLRGDEFLQSLQVSLNVRTGGLRDSWPELDRSLRTENWDAEVISEDEVRFSKTISPETLAGLRSANVQFSGPIRITKTWRAVTSDVASDEGYHFLLDVEVVNLGELPADVHLQMTGPTGTTIEGWWYQMKIHGRSSALFYSAGARDVMISTSGDPYSFWGGPEIISGYLEDETPTIISPNETAEARRLNYAAVDTHYFIAAVLPAPDAKEHATSPLHQPISFFSAFAVPASEIPETKKRKRTTDLTFRLFSDSITLPPNPDESAEKTFRQSFQVFVGPKEADVLAEYGLEDARTFGWFAVFSKPLIWLLRLFYQVIPNYALAIIFLTFLVRLAMMPISRKAAKNAVIMQYLQPEMKKIAEKYKDDLQKRGQAQNALLKKYNCRPLGGCLLMFLQLPIFVGLYRGISVDVGLRDKPFIPGLDWCNNLAGPDQLFYWGDWGLPFLFSQTGWLGPYFNILPLVTVVLFLVQQKLFAPPATDDQQKMMQRMMTFMMLFMGVLFFKVSSGLCIYFITSSIWGIMERKLIPKPEAPEDVKRLGGGGSDTGSDDGPDGKSPGPHKPTLLERMQQSRAAGNGDSGIGSGNRKLQDRRKFDRERRRRLKERRN